MGRSRGGLTTKIHALLDGSGRLVDLMPAPGQAHDLAAAERLLGNLPHGCRVLADKAYDCDWLRDAITAQGAVPNVPGRRSRKVAPAFEKSLYKMRNVVERFFNKIKHFRRIATRFEKHAENFLAMIKLAALRIQLRINEYMS